MKRVFLSGLIALGTVSIVSANSNMLVNTDMSAEISVCEDGGYDRIHKVYNDKGQVVAFWVEHVE